MRNVAFAAALLVVALLDPSRSSAADTRSSTLIVGPSVYWLRINQGDMVNIEVGDQVTDGCWLTVNDTKSAVALELTRSGFTIADPKGSKVTFYLNALGWGVGNNFCVVSYHVSTIIGTADHFYSNNHEVISLVPSVVWSQGGLITASKQTIHSLLKEKFIGLSQQFLVELAKSKRVALEQIRDSADEDGGAKLYWTRYESK